MQLLANRNEELNLFLDIANGNHERRILLIEGESGLGKTTLLEQFVEHCPSNIHCISIDLKSAQSGISYIFSKVSSRLGSQHFTQLTELVKDFLKKENVEIRDNEMIGQHQQIKVVLDVDPRDRQFHLDTLRKAFFQGLREIGFRSTIVLIFDTFNEASDELAIWLGGEFLSDVADNPSLRVVIAGQNVPRRTIEWSNLAEYRCLEAIHDVDAWCAFVQNRGWDLPRDAVSVLSVYLKGQPMALVSAFKSVTGEGRIR